MAFTTKNEPLPVYMIGTGVYPMSLSSGFIDMTDPTVRVSLDSATLTRPTTQCGTDKYARRREANRGTLMVIQAVYDASASGTLTSGVFEVWGRYSGSDEAGFIRLQNKAGKPSATMSLSLSGDATDGTYRYSQIDNDDHIFDGLGCDEFVVGCTTRPSAGTVQFATYSIRAKLI